MDREVIGKGNQMDIMDSMAFLWSPSFMDSNFGSLGNCKA